jgi:succinate dehydrogenase flavin-adding protein (antitoxin of CptAB toxin-antitoxin module)
MLADYFNLDLTEELNLDNLPEDKKQQLVEQMTDTVTARLNNAFLSRLDDEQKQELDKILEKDGDVMGFIKESVPNAQMIATEIIADFKKEAVELQNDIRQRVKAAS